MSGKRKKRGKIEKFQCHYCECRLWRIGSQRYKLVPENLTMVVQAGMNQQPSALTAGQDSVADTCAWLEEFFCGDHGKMWMLVREDAQGRLQSHLPSDHDWKRTVGTLSPDRPNPSVSEFTYRMSRGTGRAFTAHN